MQPIQINEIPIQIKDYTGTIISITFPRQGYTSNVGIIDWGGGSLGDPRYDVSIAIRPKPNAFEKESDKQLFFEGYGERIITDRDYDYFVKGLYEFF